MPHMIWKGAVSFGLVHVPVRLFPATSHESVGFDLLDSRTLDPIGYRKINKTTGKEVDKTQIVRGIEYEKGKYVVLSNEEIRGANVESTQTIDILAFVDAPQVSFLYLETPYFLEPDRGGDKVYALLREALKRAGKIGIANVVMHGKQHLAALVPMGQVLALNTLRWASEVRDPAELKLPAEGLKQAGVAERELEMAVRLIGDMSEDWQPQNYHDTFHDDILALVERKVKEGRTKEVDHTEAPAAPRRSADIVDLTELLKRSLGGRSADVGGADGAKAATKVASKTATRSATKAPAKRRARTSSAATAHAADKPASRRKQA